MQFQRRAVRHHRAERRRAQRIGAANLQRPRRDGHDARQRALVARQDNPSATALLHGHCAGDIARQRQVRGGGIFPRLRLPQFEVGADRVRTR